MTSQAMLQKPETAKISHAAWTSAAGAVGRSSPAGRDGFSFEADLPAVPSAKRILAL